MATPAAELGARHGEGAAARARAAPGRDRAFLAASALVFVACAAGTVVWCGAMAGGMPMPGGWTMSMAWMRMPGQSWPGAAAMFMGMWLVMMAAMMTPSLVPMLKSYRRTLRGAGETGVEAPTAFVGAGYFLAWAAVGAAAYPVGVALASAEMRSPALARAVPAATGVVLLLAGALQLTAWTARQLDGCRNSPACCGPASPHPLGALRAGLRAGVQCAVCCAPPMGVLLAAGVMDLGLMAGVTAAITLERTAPRALLAARAAGVVILAAGVAAIVRALSPS